MSDLRQAAQAVVDRWDSPKWEWSQQGPTADLIAALRTALEQQAEPVAAESITDAMMNLVDRLGSESKQVDLRAWQHLLVYAPQQQAEPVSTHRITSWGHCGVCRHDRIPGEGCARQECPDSHQRKEDE